MKIGIIGTGRMATGLGTGWANAGHTIFFGSRNVVARAHLAENIANSKVVEQRSAIEQGEVIVLAIPYIEVEPFARAHANWLRRKIVIDISNPFDHLPDNRISGAETTTEAIGPGARVVAAFKDNFWKTLLVPVDPQYELIRDVHYAGDNPEDKEIVSQLIADLGFRAVDCGALKNARVLDVMVPLMLELDQRYANSQARSSWRFLA